MDSTSSSTSSTSNATSSYLRGLVASTGDYKSEFNVGGLVSGLNVDDIVTKLKQIDAKPIVEMENKKQSLETQLTAWKQLNIQLSSVLTSTNMLARTTSFTSKLATSSDETVLKATAASTAGKGSYNISVKQLAKTHSMKSDSFTDYNLTTFGTGTITLTVGGMAVDVAIDSNNNTLEGIAGAINGSGADVTASIVQTDSTHWQMTLTSKKDGTAGAISLASSGISGLSFTDLQEAQDAKVRVGSDASYIEITRSTNTINDAVPGVSLNLLKLGDNIQVNVNNNAEGTRKTLEGFMTSYNKLVDYFSDQFYYDAQTGKQGTLQGNNTLILIQNKIDSILFGGSGNPGKYHSLSEIGINASSGGKLSITDETKFADAIANNSDFEKLFNDPENGIAVKLKSYIDDITRGQGGAITEIQNYTQNEIDEVEKDIIDRTEYVSRMETLYRKQYTDLEVALSTMKNQSSSIISQLTALTGSS